MPHWESIDRGRWKGACKLAGIHFIDPRLPVLEVVTAIQETETLLAEAMHGAIVADALRVPWVPVMPFHPAHRAKWYDWAEALSINLIPSRVLPSSFAEAWLKLRSRESQLLRRGNQVTRWITAGPDAPFAAIAASSLSALKRVEPSLSADPALSLATEKLQHAAERIRSDFRH
jgi:succinoglycan biosynthesis protein ExoV